MRNHEKQWGGIIKEAPKEQTESQDDEDKKE